MDFFVLSFYNFNLIWIFSSSYYFKNPKNNTRNEFLTNSGLNQELQTNDLMNHCWLQVDI